MYPKPVAGIPITVVGPTHTITASATAVAAALAQVDGSAARRLAADAEQFAHDARDPGERARALAGVAATVAVLDRDHALRLATDAEKSARAVGHPAERVRALGQVASAFALLDLDRSLQIATETEQAARAQLRPQDLGPALIPIASVYARAGQWEQAQQISQMTDGPAHAEAALVIAEAMIAKVKAGQANQELLIRGSWLIASVLVSEYWHQALSLLGQIAPEAIEAVLNRLLRSADLAA